MIGSIRRGKTSLKEGGQGYKGLRKHSMNMGYLFPLEMKIYRQAGMILSMMMKRRLKTIYCSLKTMKSSSFLRTPQQREPSVTPQRRTPSRCCQPMRK